MPISAESRQTQKIQPWKAHWPPATKTKTKTKTESGVEYGVEKGGVIVVDGTSVRVSPPRKDSKKDGSFEANLKDYGSS